MNTFPTQEFDKITLNEFIHFLKKNLEIDNKITLLSSNNLRILLNIFNLLSKNGIVNTDDFCHYLINDKTVEKFLNEPAVLLQNENTLLTLQDILNSLKVLFIIYYLDSQRICQINFSH